MESKNIVSNTLTEVRRYFSGSSGFLPGQRYGALPPAFLLMRLHPCEQGNISNPI
jgi:hypothetical protein